MTTQRKATARRSWTTSLIFLLASLTAIVGAGAWGRARLQRSIDELEHATGCPVVEEPMPGCAPITVPYLRDGARMYLCCPRRAP